VQPVIFGPTGWKRWKPIPPMLLGRSPFLENIEMDLSDVAHVAWITLVDTQLKILLRFLNIAERIVIETDIEITIESR
jgi:hypothetical protein